MNAVSAAEYQISGPFSDTQIWHAYIPAEIPYTFDSQIKHKAYSWGHILQSP